MSSLKKISRWTIIRSLTVVAAFALYPIDMVSAAPFTNGSFETGPGSTAPPWTLSADAKRYNESANPAASDGDFFVAIGENGHIAFIEQTFDTINGTTYTLKFDYRTYDFLPASDTLEVLVKGTVSTVTLLSDSFSVPNTGNTWSTYSNTFTADGAATTLRVTSVDVVFPQDALVDNFTVTAAASSGVPEPSTFVLAALGLAGLGLVAWKRRRVRG